MGCGAKKRTTHIVLIVLGLVLIIAGVLVGRFLVRTMASRIETKNCLPTSASSEKYKTWTSKMVRKTYVTFWSIKNKDDFLYQGKLPQLEEMGPYVYTTTVKKVEVVFGKGTISFKEYKTQQFDATLTHEKCPSCSETDQVTMLNTAYIGLIMKFKGDVAFSIFMIPNVVNNFLQRLLQSMPSKQYVYTYLGNHTETLDNPSAPSFGPWLGTNPNFVASIIVGSRQGMSYNWTEMEALYNVLSNSSLLLPTPNTTDPFAKGKGLMTYLQAYLTIAQTYNTTTNATINAAIGAQMEKLKANMMDLLCPSRNSSCFEVKDTATVQVLTVFITTHLTAASMAFLDGNNYGLITVRPVKELVQGYVMSKLPLNPQFPNGIPVAGVLTNHSGENDAIQRGKAESLYTCESDTGTPSSWEGYDGTTAIPQSYFPNAPSSQLKIAGSHVSQFTATKTLSPCTNKYPHTAKHFDIFNTGIFQTLRLTYQQPVESYGVHMNRYTLDESNLKTNNVTVFMDGLIDISNIRGIPLSISAPGFLHGQPSLHKQLSMAEPTFAKYGTTVDIEPVTGKPMDVVFRVQVNSVITKDVISAKRLRPLNITFYETGQPYTKYFPLFWTQEGGSLTKKDAEFLKDQVFSFFSISCTITMVLPIFGAISLLTGTILLVWTLKKKHSNVSQAADS